MQYNTDDVRIAGMEEVLAPEEIIKRIPVTAGDSELVYTARLQTSDVIGGEDSRLLVVVGPCSIHDPQSAKEYAQKLAKAANEFKSSLLVLMRVYFEKPRTTIGWKGLINDPHLNGSYAINEGLAIARKLLSEIADLYLPVGTEYLDPITPQYLGDLVTWSAIGARTSESQIHRQLASGLSCPVGFKNSTHGNVQIAVDAVKSAMNQHVFPSVNKAGHTAIFETTGNEHCHIILRGGGGSTNFDSESIHDASQLLEDAGLNPLLMVDMSHANSSKDHRRQLEVCKALSQQISEGDSRIMGVMIESHLVEGNQSIGDGVGLVYGQSITDACISWDDTYACLDQLAEAVESRRNAN